MLLPTFQHTSDYHSYAIGFKALLRFSGAGVGLNALFFSSLQSRAFNYRPLSSSVRDLFFRKREKKNPPQILSGSSSEACYIARIGELVIINERKKRKKKVGENLIGPEFWKDLHMYDKPSPSNHKTCGFEVCAS